MQESVAVRPNEIELQRTKLIAHYRDSNEASAQEPTQPKLGGSDEGDVIELDE